MWAACWLRSLGWRWDGRLEVRMHEFAIQNLVGRHVGQLVNC